jgi:Leucine-rich repeat (LRR) protein
MPVLPALTSLELSHTGITSLQGLPAKLPELKTISLIGTKVGDLETLISLPTLKEIELRKEDYDPSLIPANLRARIRRL